MVHKIKEALRLTRIEHSIMLVIAVLAAEFLTGSHPRFWTIILSLLPPIFISASAFVINDYYDIKADKANGFLDRPLVSGTISKLEAAVLYIACLVMGLLLATLLGFIAFTIVAIFAALSFLYSYWLKKTLLIGNAYIALSMVIPFIYGGYIASDGINNNIAC